MRMTLSLVEENMSEFLTTVCSNSICPPERQDKLIGQRFPLYHCQLSLYKMNRYFKNIEKFSVSFPTPLYI